MSSINSWNIRPRSNRCCITDREFDNDEIFYTAIFFNNETNSYERSDFSVQAWEKKPQSNDEKNLFSFWRSKFEKEEPAMEKEVVEKESAEVMLRRLIDENDPSSENARYILAVMLERKKILTPVDVKNEKKSKMLFYEHQKTGEAFIVRDPILKLDEIDTIQEEVSLWLNNEQKQDPED